MPHLNLSLIFTLSMLAAAPAPVEQAPSAAQRPSLSGVWRPSDSKRSDVYFDNGLGWVPGNGRIVIEQALTRLTITKHIPDEKLDPLLAIHGHYYPAVIYRIAEDRGRAGGTGAGGSVGSSWQGDRLVLTQTRAGSRLSTVSVSLDGDRLKFETHVVIAGGGKESTVAEWFERVPPSQVPVISSDPAVQRTLEAQLAGAASIRLNSNTRIASLNLTSRSLKEILDAIAQAGGVAVNYASGTPGLDTASSVALSDQTVEDALREALKGQSLTFQVTGPKSAFIYPDTPAHREKYTATVRVFPIAKGDPTVLSQQLNRVLKPTSDGFRAMVLTVREPRCIVVRAVPELMAWIATWIAENDRSGPRSTSVL